MTDYKKLKVPELKELLSARGLETTGLKAQLVERLEQADAAAPAVSETQAAQSQPVSADSAPAAAAAAAATPAESAEQHPPPQQQPSAAAQSAAKDDEPAPAAAVVDGIGAADKDQEVADPAPEAPPKADGVSDQDRKLQRAQRFGLPVVNTEVDKKAARAQRFASTTASVDNGSAAKTTPPSDEEAKKAARTARFGTAAVEELLKRPADAANNGEAKKPKLNNGTGAKAAMSEAEKEKLKARAERFNLPLSEKTGEAPQAATADAQVKREARTARFNTSSTTSTATATATTTSQKLSPEDEEKRKKRLERFAQPAQDKSKPEEEATQPAAVAS